MWDEAPLLVWGLEVVEVSCHISQVKELGGQPYKYIEDFEVFLLKAACGWMVPFQKLDPGAQI